MRGRLASNARYEVVWRLFHFICRLFLSARRSFSTPQSDEKRYLFQKLDFTEKRVDSNAVVFHNSVVEADSVNHRVALFRVADLVFRGDDEAIRRRDLVARRA